MRATNKHHNWNERKQKAAEKSKTSDKMQKKRQQVRFNLTGLCIIADQYYYHSSWDQVSKVNQKVKNWALRFYPFSISNFVFLH